MELVSVIIPVFNVAPYLNRCIESVLLQTYRNIEIILIDDGSIDESKQICDDYASIDSRVKVIHKQNGGVSLARNVGIDKAVGEFILFVDGDDFIKESMLEQLLQLQHRTGAPIVCSGFEKMEDGVITNACGKFSEIVMDSDEIAKSFFDDGYVKNIMYPPWNKLFSRSIFDTVRFNESLRIGEDFVFNMKAMFVSKRIAFIDCPLYVYCIRENSAMTAAFSERRIDYIVAAREIVSIYNEHCPNMINNAERWYYNHVLITLKRIYVLSMQNRYSQFVDHANTYIKENRRYVQELSIVRKIDYLFVTYGKRILVHYEKVKEMLLNAKKAIKHYCKR